MLCDLTGPYAYDPHVQVLWGQVADPLAPTETEVFDAVTLNDAPYHLTDIIGWEVESDILRDPPWRGFENQRVGGQRIAQSDLIFAADREGDDIRSLIERGDFGTILILPSGPYIDIPDAPLNVYPVRVAQVSQQQRLRTGGGSLLLVQFAVTGAVVGQNVEVVIGSS